MSEDELSNDGLHSQQSIGFFPHGCGYSDDIVVKKCMGTCDCEKTTGVAELFNNTPGWSRWLLVDGSWQHHFGCEVEQTEFHCQYCGCKHIYYTSSHRMP